ncbi:YopT-type cysteine protease domain-containing protein [Xanthomonas vasicola]|uniref:YopT-type cysteine protease domain-containing protein n=1 Tax=Xanthomonas vasicola TaxID=56459 RepID=UPI001FCA3790|nr:YopT-type cysteine protease domain-containing protein [Xanthomonas vasicola]
MATTRLSRPIATPPAVHSEIQAPARPDQQSEPHSYGNATSCGLLAGLSRRPLRARSSTSSLPAPRAGMDQHSRDAQTAQPAKANATSVDCADVLARLKATFGSSAHRAPSDTSVFMKSHRLGFAQDKKTLETVFEGDEMGISGVCAGLSAFWMSLHCAVPDGSVETRLRTLGSFDGLHHALAYKKCYALSLKELWDRSVVISKSLDSKARTEADEIYGITRDRQVTKSTSSAAKMADAMARVDGYASIVYKHYDKDAKPIGHEMGMHRNPEDGMITFFDPNFGEFRFRSDEAAQFLRALRERHETSSKVEFNWLLTKVRPNIVGKHTPVDLLVDVVKADHASSSRTQENSGSIEGQGETQ